ncbi:MAG: integrase [Nitrososphaerota archaeon]
MNPGPPPCQGSNSHEFVNKLVKGLVNEVYVGGELQLYQNYLKLRGLRDKSVKDRIQYLKRFLFSGLPLNVEGILTFLGSLHGHAKVHGVKALRLYLKLKGRRDLLEIVKTPVVREQPKTYCPTLEEVVKVAEEISWLPAKVLFILLAESGLRPGELYYVKLSKIDLDAKISEVKTSGIDVENRIIVPLKEASSKQAFCSFYTSSELVKRYVEEFNIKSSLFPQSKRMLRAKIYEGMEKALGKIFELYALRRFWATEMYRRGMNPLTIDLLQGRKPRIYRVMLTHYLKLSLKDLRREYDKTNLKISFNNS